MTLPEELGALVIVSLALAFGGDAATAARLLARRILSRLGG